MPSVNFESLIQPVSDEEPCGVDLELNGDVDYMNFVAGAEGLLPKSFFGKDQAGNEDRPFDRSSIDFDAQFNAAKPFLQQTRDLRLLGILAKFSILNRDLPGFVACVRAMSTLLETHWEQVHPRGEDGDFGLRMVSVEAIDSMPTVVMPLQFLPLINHKRLGWFSYRNYMIAKGEAPPREEDEPLDLASVEKILEEAALPELVQRRAQLAELDAALKHIRQTWMANSPSGPSAVLERLPTSVAQILALFDVMIAKLDPSAAAAQAEASDGADGAARPAVAGRITTQEQAAAALAGAATYFSSREPSSPALLLIRQAHALLGKSFLEVLRVLVPDQVDRAAFNIGREQFFDLPIAQLATYLDGEPAPAEAEPETPAEESEPTPDESEAATAEEGATTDEEPAPAEEEAQDVQPEADATEAAPEESGSAPSVPVVALSAQLKVNSRTEALAALEQVGIYLRAVEPSSPIPFLIERARDLAQRDFLSVLKALLPADGLRSTQPPP